MQTDRDATAQRASGGELFGRLRPHVDYVSLVKLFDNFLTSVYVHVRLTFVHEMVCYIIMYDIIMLANCDYAQSSACRNENRNCENEPVSQHIEMIAFARENNGGKNAHTHANTHTRQHCVQVIVYENCSI